MFKLSFIELLGKFISDKSLLNEYWNAVERAYAANFRHYHTLKHLDVMLSELILVKDDIQDWDTLLFSVAYHDIVYNVLKSNNEEQSALFSEKCLLKLNIQDDKVQLCKSHILATKKHTLSKNTDTNFLLDADLTVLGKPWETYREYCSNIRKEYKLYPDFLYKPGRKKVIAHLLSMEFIYKTPHFQHKYEETAKLNLQKELQLYLS